jgi:hypothetical protein
MARIMSVFKLCVTTSINLSVSNHVRLGTILKAVASKQDECRMASHDTILLTCDFGSVCCLV